MLLSDDCLQPFMDLCRLDRICLSLLVQSLDCVISSVVRFVVIFAEFVISTLEFFVCEV